MNILLPTDSFPPVCGGSGWSTYELARGLRARGHRLTIVQPRPGTSGVPHNREYDGFEVIETPAFAPDVPYVRNYFKNERLYAALQPFLQRVIAADAIDLVHAQHVLTGPPSILAARAAGVPAVCTVRDYWPVCYWSDLVHDRSSATLCPGCSMQMMTRCVRPRAGAAWPLALPLIPYMAANLEHKRAVLALSDAVIAVSTTIARDLRARAPELAQTRIETIPNAVDIAGLRDTVAGTFSPLGGPYLLYVGKIAPNKGTSMLLQAVRNAPPEWPLVVVGDGPDRVALEEEARHANRRVLFQGWLPRSDALRWARHATLLVFPSSGPESLSRVLLEAAALGVPIAAMDTGGTRDIITHEVTGLLSDSGEGLASDVARLAHDRPLRERLAAAAAQSIAANFEAAAVIARIERLYAELLGRKEAAS